MTSKVFRRLTVIFPALLMAFFCAAVIAEAQAPRIYSITPDQSLPVADLFIEEISGDFFVPGTLVFLEGDGAEISAREVEVVNPQTMTCVFNLEPAPPGIYDVVVKHQGDEDVLVDGFTVLEQPRDPATAKTEFTGGACGLTGLSGGLLALLLIAPLFIFRRLKAVRFFLGLPLLLVAASLIQAAEMSDDLAPELFPHGPTFDLSGYYGVHGPEPMGHLEFGLNLGVIYTSRLLYAETNGEETDILNDRLTGTGTFALGITRYFDFGLVFPYTITQTWGDDLTGRLEDLPTSGGGDLRIGAKVLALSPAEYPVGMSIIVEGKAPTGWAKDLMGQGAGTLSFGPAIGSITGDVSLNSQILYEIRLAEAEKFGELDLADNLHLGFGVGYNLEGWVEFFGELQATTVAKTFFGETPQAPVITTLGLRVNPHAKLALVLGGSVGVTDGVGAGQWRVFGGFSVLPMRKHRSGDRDGDGISDDADNCPDVKEDLDGFQDNDGCPEPDNDADGIPDERDGEPNWAEDPDGFEDLDGVPDLDNDGDGFPDDQDACPEQAEDANGRWDFDGCPDEKMPEGLRVLADRIVTEPPIAFQPNTNRLVPESKKVLRILADYLKVLPQNTLVRIEVHLDNSLGLATALEVSANRAEVIKQYLFEQGVPLYQVIAVGQGSSKPLASNRTVKGREKNQRVEFWITTDE